MSYSGFQTTKKGRDLIGKLLAEKTLKISKVVAGSGVVATGDLVDNLEDLISPVLVGTSSIPDYVGDTMTMTLQFRSDLSVASDIWVQEYGVFAIDPDLGEILLYYGALGDRPQQLPGNLAKYSGVLDFHISIAIGEDLDGVQLGYPASAFLLKEELENHEKDVNAHQDLMYPRMKLSVSQDEPQGFGVYFWLTDVETFRYD